MQRKKIVLGFCSIILFLSLIPLLPVQAQEVKNGDITFEPNVVPFTTVYKEVNKTSDVEGSGERFRFEWNNPLDTDDPNRFDIELFFNATIYKKYDGVWQNVTKMWSLHDFEDDFECTTNFMKNQNESVIQWGWEIDNPDLTNEWLHHGWMRIEDTYPFEVDDIQLETIEPTPEMNFTIKRFHLPDNLVLSFEDLFFKGFMVDVLNPSEVVIWGFEGKTHLNLDPITYSSPTITVIGGTEGVPLDFKDIWDADQIGGWNVVHNNNNTNTQFEFDCNIHLGNDTVAGTTYFNDTSKQIVFADNIVSANYETRFLVNNYAYATFGKLNSATEKSSEDGCSFINEENGKYSTTFLVDANGEINFYSCHMLSAFLIDRNYFRNGDVYNSIFCGRNVGISVSPTSMDIFNTYLSGGYEGWRNPSGSTFDTIWSFDAKTTNIYLVVASGTFTFTTLYQRSGGNIIADARTGTTAYLIDADIDNWNFSWAFAGSGLVYRQYTFDLTTLFPNQTAVTDCNVSLTDVDNTELFNVQTDANGQITQQTVTYGFYNQTGGDTIYLKSPHTLKVFRKGVRMYESVFNITDKTDLTLTLSPRAWSAGTPSGSITYDLVSFVYDTIVVTNFTENNPCTFQDVCDVNDENGWGAVDAIGTSMFFFEQTTLNIGDWVSNMTYFEDKNVQVTFGDGVNWIDSIRVKNGTITLGELVDATNKITRRGCSMFFHYTEGLWTEVYSAEWAGIANLYDCSFTGIPDVDGGELETYASMALEGNTTAYNVMVSFMYEWEVGHSTNQNGQQDLFNVLMTNMTNAGLSYSGTPSTIEKTEVLGAYYLAHFGGNLNLTINDFYGRNATNTSFNVWESYSNDVEVFLINPDVDAWTFTWADHPYTTTVHRQYTLDLTVTYPNGIAIDGATVTINHYGQTETEDYNGTTDSNGQIPQQTLSMGFYNVTGGNTIYNYNPYNIEIIGVTGYQDYNNNFTLGEQTEWTIALTPTVPELFDSTYYLLGGLSFLPISLLFAFLLRRKQDADRL